MCLGRQSITFLLFGAHFMCAYSFFVCLLYSLHTCVSSWCAGAQRAPDRRADQVDRGGREGGAVGTQGRAAGQAGGSHKP